METTVPAPGATGEVPSTTLERGHRIGRFFVLSRLGQGGMGEVYAAYDPELDRKVAIKLLNPGLSLSVDEHALLLREAQATAKLQHPNVVVIYDVGTHDERVFIAMELIEGQTLRAWMRTLQASPQSWREILRVFVAAGRGLAAAHDAGLVHRDFKPDNVMVTPDGRVRVMDFGLARAASSQPDGAPDLSESRQTVADDEPAAMPYLEADLTGTGMRVGTPAYMALEQLIPGGEIDARADQFAFCVALYEALYGERPFGKGNAGQLTLRVGAGAISPPPPGSAVPLWVRRIVLRGLRARREERYPSMAELLAALSDDPAVRRRRWLSLAGVVALLVVVAVGARHVGGPSSRCGGAASQLAGVWEPGGAPSLRKEGIRRAFLATGAPYAEAALASVTRLLDGYATRWVAGHTDACEATHVRGEQATEVLDLRMDCLRARLGNLRAFTDVLVSADVKVVENAVSAAAALPDVAECADVAALRTVVALPTDPARRARVAQLRGELARFIALRDSGQCARASSVADSLIAGADATGYDPLRAEVLAATGYTGDVCSDSAVAVARLKAAYNAAVAGRSDATAAEAAIEVPVLLRRLGDVSGARDWVEIARAAVKRSGGGGRLESWFLLSEAEVRATIGDYAGAVEGARASLAVKRRIFGARHPDTIISLENLGNLLGEAKRFREAAEIDVEALDATGQLLGASHPRNGVVASNLGEALNGLGRYAEARARFETAIDVFRRAGSDASFASYPQTGLGRALLAEGRAADAVAPLEAALAVRLEKHLAPGLVGETRFALARALWARPAERPRALELAKAAREDYRGDAEVRGQIDAWLAAPASPAAR
jgi:tRNA A-37 threonylcarbamoyl transferase component Bud32/tetratricopeptide (TPR) repeat protein